MADKTDPELSLCATDVRFNDGQEYYICREVVFIKSLCCGQGLGCSFSCGMGATLSGSCRRASSGRRRSRLLRRAVARYTLKRIHFLATQTYPPTCRLRGRVNYNYPVRTCNLNPHERLGETMAYICRKTFRPFYDFGPCLVYSVDKLYRSSSL